MGKFLDSLFTFSLVCFSIFREVLVGKDEAGCVGPRCRKLTVESVKIHQNWNNDNFTRGFDIALVRVNGLIDLDGVVSPFLSQLFEISIIFTGLHGTSLFA